MIKTRIIEQPTTRTVDIECPHCKTMMMRIVKLDKKRGYEECSLCHTKFEWEETEGDTVK